MNKALKANFNLFASNMLNWLYTFKDKFVAAYDWSIDMNIGINDKDSKQGIYTMAIKLEDKYLFFNKIHTLYDTRSNIILLYENDSALVIDTTLL